MQIKDPSCVRINCSTEPAHAKTEASVSGYRLDSGTRSTNFEIIALNISILQERIPRGKKMKICMLGVLVIQIAELFLFFALVAPDVVNREFLNFCLAPICE